MYVRRIQPEDVESCVEIVRLNFNQEVADRFRDEVLHVWSGGMKWPPIYYVALDCEPEDDVEGAELPVMGFAGMVPSWIMHNVWDFIWINIHPEYQNSGIGKMLTQYRIDTVWMYGGTVIKLMTQKPKFFEMFGFKVVENIDGWMLMTKRLRPVVLT